MRIAVVSDIHGNLPALEAFVEELRAHPVDSTVNLGDALSGPLWPQETATRLRALNWPTLAGNHERQVLTLDPAVMSEADAFTRRALDPQTLAWMRTLVATAWIHDEVFACHATPTGDLDYLLETVIDDFDPTAGRLGLRPASDDEILSRLHGPSALERHAWPAVILCGHTHVPRVRMLSNTLLLNPGSLGQPAFDDDHPHRHWVENGSPQARFALLERGPGGWSARLQTLNYDWEASAARAQAQGRDDWADALRSGRVGRTEAEVVGRRRPPEAPR